MKLELFKFDSCPYCQRVFREIEAEGRTDIEYHDIHKSSEDRERLIREGGQEMVPCLFIDGKPMYESLDIVDWLKAHPQSSSVLYFTQDPCRACLQQGDL